MQLQIYINNKLYRTVTLETESYRPDFIWPEIQADRDSGMLTSFDLSKGLAIRYEKVA
jgi:hypothetical protein